MEERIKIPYLPIDTELKNGTYCVEAAIASGGFGKTYVVSHKVLGIKRAMKEFFHADLNDRGTDGKSVLTVSSRRTAHGNMIQSFLKEAQKIAGLNHRNIIKVHDYFEENGTAYYVMDLIYGYSLQQKLDSTNRPLPEKDVRNYLNQLLDALEHIHSKGILHLDLKPSNIMLGNDGTITLIDFGASKGFNADGSLSSNSKFSYTPGYAPIELKDCAPHKIGTWTDFYSLGATLYKMLTNKTVPDYSDISDYYQGITTVNPFDFTGVASDFQRLIQACMRPNRTQRPQVAAQVRAMLAPPIPVPPIPVPPIPEDSKYEPPQNVGNNEETFYYAGAAVPPITNLQPGGYNGGMGQYGGPPQPPISGAPKSSTKKTILIIAAVILGLILLMSMCASLQNSYETDSVSSSINTEEIQTDEDAAAEAAAEVEKAIDEAIGDVEEEEPEAEDDSYADDSYEDDSYEEDYYEDNQ